MRALRRLPFLGLAAAVAVGCAPAHSATTTATTPTQGRPPTTSAPSTYEVATRVLPLRDDSRSAGKTAGRDLPTTLFYPKTGDGPFPVVVFSHGFQAEPESYWALLTGWAAAGFVVAAPSFPLTHRGATSVTDIVNQPADVRFVLGRVLALDHTAGDPLEGRIDAHHVAAAGHSAGAATTIGLLDSCCSDPRVTAALVLTGTARAFGTDFVKPGIPTLVLHGTDDDVIPPADGRAVYSLLPGPKAFVSLLGGTHHEPYDTASDPHFPAVLAVTTDFLRWALDGRDDAAAALRKDANRPGIAALSDDRLSG